MKPIVQPSDKWYLSLLNSVSRRLPPLAAWLAHKADTYEDQAIAAYEQRDLAQAAASYQHAIDWQPSNTDYRGKLGQVYSEWERFEEAESAFRFALALDYQDRRSLKGLGLVLYQQGKLLDAMYYYLRFADFEPKDIDVCHNLCVVFYELGRYDEAVVWSDRAMALAPSDPLVLRMRAQALAAVGRLAEVRGVLDRAAEISPDDPQIDRLLGLTLDLQGQPEASLKAYQEAARKEPGNADVRLQLARLSAVLGRFEDAAEESRRAVSLFTASEDNQGVGASYWELGWSCYNLGDMEASFQASTEALKFDPLLTPVYFNLGLVLLHLGRVEQARAKYDEGVARVIEVSDLKSHAIDDLQRALEKNPNLTDAVPILHMLEQEYAERSRVVANPDDSTRAAAAEPIAPSATGRA